MDHACQVGTAGDQMRLSVLRPLQLPANQSYSPVPTIQLSVTHSCQSWQLCLVPVVLGTLPLTAVLATHGNDTNPYPAPFNTGLISHYLKASFLEGVIPHRPHSTTLTFAIPSFLHSPPPACLPRTHVFDSCVPPTCILHLQPFTTPTCIPATAGLTWQSWRRR